MGGAPLTGGWPLSRTALMAEAEAKEHLSDWGDTGFVGALDLLLESCRETARLTAEGVGFLRRVCLRHLRNRLALQPLLGGVAPAPVGGVPVVITGLPRTGTTVVHNLMATDGGLRPLRLWEALRPAAAASGQPPGDLIKVAEAWLAGFYSLAPGFRAVHPLTATGPEECDALLQNSFASLHFDDMFDARAYSAWFAGADLGDAYGYYRSQLEVLGRAGGAGGAGGVSGDRERPWLLKSPGHLGHLDALLAVLPGAVVVHCHRHPVEAVASYASLIRAARAPHTGDLDLAVIGWQAAQRAARAVERAMAVRDRAGAGSFVDVAFHRLVEDPLATMADIYRGLGRRLGPEVAEDMGRWLADNPAGSGGDHRYSLAEFSLHEGEVAEAFSSYAERFAAFLPPGRRR